VELEQVLDAHQEFLQVRPTTSDMEKSKGERKKMRRAEGRERGEGQGRSNVEGAYRSLR
jgi:hypothetical protein